LADHVRISGTLAPPLPDVQEKARRLDQRS